LHLSLRGRLFAGYVLVALVGLVTFLMLAMPEQKRWLIARNEQFLEPIATLAARDLALEGRAITEIVPPASGTRAPGDAAAPDWPAAADSLGRALGLRVTLIDPDGVVRGDSQVPRRRLDDLDNHGGRDEVRAALAGRPGHAVRRSATLGVELVYVAVPAKAPGIAVLRVAQPITTIAAINASLLRLSAGTVAGTFVVILLGVSWLTAREARRVDALRRVAERVGAGQFEARAPEQPGDDLGRLGRSINEMSADLRERLDALERQRDERERILAHMSDGVALIDGDDRFVHANHQLATMLGAPLPARFGTAFQEYARTPDLRELIHAARKAGHTLELETRIWAPHQRFLRATATPIGGHERPAVLLVLHDLTDIEQLNRVRQDFVANVSHELRTPLTSLRGYAETLLEGGLDDVQHREGFVRTIRDQAARLSALVEDLLALAELEGRGAALRVETFDLREVVDRQMASFRPAVEAGGLTFDLEPGEPVRVAADRVRIEQVLANLIDNATKYTDRGGVRVRLGRSDTMAWCEVSDTGAGIPEEDRPRIFERFYRVDKARAREKGGTGLGLSIVKHVIALHRGRVSVESEPGRGSTFRFEIPIEAQAV
jgi:two-component system, OmpR family, phosphate regulon sensor histidine kinase PhoR